MSTLNRVASVVGEFVTPIYVVRAPLIAAGAAVAFLTLPGQTLELYRALALDRVKFAPQILLAFLTLFIASLLLWQLGRILTLRWQRDQLMSRSISGFMLRWLPRLIGSLPLFAAAIGMVRSADRFITFEIPEWIEAQMPGTISTIREADAAYAQANELLHVAAWIAAGLGVLLIAITFIRSAGRQWKYETPNPWLFGLPVRIIFYLLAAGLTLAFSAYFFGDPTKYGLLANYLGSFAIFNLFIICLAFFLSALTNIYDRSNVPALSLLITLGLVATAFDLNDNHGIRTLKKDAFLALPSSYTGFQEWLRTRADREFFKSRDEEYPVYIVAAQGGGLYAAQHVALALARLQDRCPGFAQHVFAISGVSGGSLGSAVFSSLVREKAQPVTEPGCRFGVQPEGWFEENTREILGHDFLAPLTAAGFFPDFVQRMIPYPIAGFDRARALEASFESAWASAVPESKSNPFSESFYRHWKPSGISPALVLNATQVKTGGRVAIAPFRFYQQPTLKLPTINSMIKADIALSTAVGISARFPWVLPPASWRRGDLEQYRFVDGGYFESSGIDTAHDLVNLLEDYITRLRESGQLDMKVRINLIILTTDDILQESVATANADKVRELRTRRSGFDEIGSPLETLLNTRWERGVVSMARAFQTFCPGCFTDREDRRTYAGIDGDARMLRLNFTDFSLTVGWQLSGITEKLVSAHSGYPERCRAARSALRDTWPWMAQVLNENNCASCQILYSLAGRQRELDNIAPATTGTNIQTRSEIPTWVELCRADASDVKRPVYKRPERGLPPPKIQSQTNR